MFPLPGPHPGSKRLCFGVCYKHTNKHTNKHTKAYCCRGVAATTRTSTLTGLSAGPAFSTSPSGQHVSKRSARLQAVSTSPSGHARTRTHGASSLTSHAIAPLNQPILNGPKRHDWCSEKMIPPQSVGVAANRCCGIFLFVQQLILLVIVKRFVVSKVTAMFKESQKEVVSVFRGRPQLVDPNLKPSNQPTVGRNHSQSEGCPHTGKVLKPPCMTQASCVIVWKSEKYLRTSDHSAQYCGKQQHGFVIPY
jgi:hypothetical protein